MACGRNARGSLEERLFELIAEYQSLSMEQLRRYFGVEETEIRKILRRLQKKGRLFYMEKEGLVLAHKEIQMNHQLMCSFWVLTDLADAVEHHFRGSYPIQLIFYANGMAYEVFYAAVGEELALSHAISHLRKNIKAKTIIIVENTEQMQKLEAEDVVFCTVNVKGEVEYYE